MKTSNMVISSTVTAGMELLSVFYYLGIDYHELNASTHLKRFLTKGRKWNLRRGPEMQAQKENTVHF